MSPAFRSQHAGTSCQSYSAYLRLQEVFQFVAALKSILGHQAAAAAPAAAALGAAAEMSSMHLYGRDVIHSHMNLAWLFHSCATGHACSICLRLAHTRTGSLETNIALAQVFAAALAILRCMQEPGPEHRCLRVQAQAAVLLLLAAALHSASANSEKGEAPETCYNTQLSSSTATVVYTKSGSPRDTTFTFLV